MIGKERAARRLFIVIALVFALTITAGLVVAESVIYHGNAKSHVFHTQTCRYYDCKNCTVEFFSKEEAVDAGYRPCKVCRP